MKESNNPPPDIKEAMLLMHAGLPMFMTNPPFHCGREERTARGFWIRETSGLVLKVSGQVWTDAFPPSLKPKIGISQKAWEQGMSNQGGRIILGLSGVKDEQDLARIEAYVPTLINEVLDKELQKAGWTIGRFGHGRFVADDGTVFNDRSTVIQIAGISSEKLKEIAMQLAIYFNQNSVMVFDDNTGKSFLMGLDKPAAAPEA
jgi:hypothetical protein